MGVVFGLSTICIIMPFLRTGSDRTIFVKAGVNCALRPSKSIRYSRDFVIAGFVIAGFVSTYFTVILPGFHMLFVITGSSLKRGSLLRGSL